MRRQGNPSRRTLEKLLAVASSSLAEFEALLIGREAHATGAAPGSLEDKRAGTWGAARLPTLPLLATNLAGEWGDSGSLVELTGVRWEELIDRLARPPSMAADNGAYALTIVGDSMWPRFRPGRRVAVSPKSPVAIGDDVVVLLRSEGQGTNEQPALIKELMRRTNDTVELRQFNPDLTFSVETGDVEAIHKIAGELT